MVRATLDRQYRDAIMQSTGLLATQGLGVVAVGSYELGDAIVVRVAVKDIGLNRVEVTVDRQHVTIRADSRSQDIELTASVQTAGAVALYHHGVLSLILRKADQQNSTSATDTVTAQSEQSFPASDAPAWPRRRQ